MCSRPLRPEVAAALCVQAAFWATTAELVASTVSGRNDKANRRADLNLSGIRVTLAEQLRISEQLIPLTNMQEFYKDHELHARLPLRYPDAVVVTNTLPRHVVEAYAKTFAATDLRKTKQADPRRPLHLISGFVQVPGATDIWTLREYSAQVGSPPAWKSAHWRPLPNSAPRKVRQFVDGTEQQGITSPRISHYAGRRGSCASS